MWRNVDYEFYCNRKSSIQDYIIWNWSWLNDCFTAHQQKWLYSAIYGSQSVLSFESSLSNTADDGDDDDDLSGFLLGLATSHTALGGSWVLVFHTYIEHQQAIPYLPTLVAFYDMLEKTAIQFYSNQNCRGLELKIYDYNYIVGKTKYWKGTLNATWIYSSKCTPLHYLLYLFNVHK